MTKEHFLAMSLPFKLKAKNLFGEIVEILGLQNGSESVNNVLWIFKKGNQYLKGYTYQCQPILHPLSDLIKLIEHKGKKFVPAYQINGYYAEYQHELALDIKDESIILQELNILLEWHFDVAGLIEKGEAIDINSLDKNPYAY